MCRGNEHRRRDRDVVLTGQQRQRPAIFVGEGELAQAPLDNERQREAEHGQFPRRGEGCLLVWDRQIDARPALIGDASREGGLFDASVDPELPVVNEREHVDPQLVRAITLGDHLLLLELLEPCRVVLDHPHCVAPRTGDRGTLHYFADRFAEPEREAWNRGGEQLIVST
ncbi:MAG TPA: hypothetical protein VGO10_05265 [Baekduia sp.]|nr:hypothetical protein [Baekduia sp.]